MKLDTFIGTFLDTDGGEHHVELRIPEAAESGERIDQSPVAIISGMRGLPAARYYVSTILQTARRSSFTGLFRVENGFGDEHGTYAFFPGEVRRMAEALERAIEPSVGAFIVTWRPAHPESPF